jgi:C-terminal processing protease CtpA/Prc
MRILFTSLALLLTLGAAADVRDAASVVRWNEDLEYFRAELPRRHHRDFFFNLPRETFDSLVDALKRDVPRLQDHEIKVRLAGIVARLGDRHGHTRVTLNNASAGFHFLPLNFHVYSDGLFIRAAAKEHAAAAGARVVRIGSTAAGEALRRVLAITAGDNDMSRRSYAQELLAMPEVLRALGIVTDGEPGAPVTIDIEDTSGAQKTITVAARPNFEGIEWADVRSLAKTQPLSRRYPPANPVAEYIPAKPYWFEYVADAKLLYVHYAAVMNTPEQTLEAFFGSVFAFADAHDVQKFVIDVRKNGGGDNTLNLPIFRELIARRETLARKDRFFVLIGRETFSAAQNFVNWIAANTEATFVGEPTGGSPNHYGDSTRFTLPNSGLVVRASTLWWQDGHPAEKASWIAPHIAADTASADDREGRDPALEAVLRHTPEPPLATRIREAILRGECGPGAQSPETRNPQTATLCKAEAAKVYAAWRSDPRNRYAQAEQTINQVAASLYGEQKVSEAVALFELNAELHPQSAAAFESLGRAYAAQQNKNAAIAAFEKALALDPRAVTALERLERLRAAPAR